MLQKTLEYIQTRQHLPFGRKCQIVFKLDLFFLSASFVFKVFFSYSPADVPGFLFCFILLPITLSEVRASVETCNTRVDCGIGARSVTVTEKATEKIRRLLDSRSSCSCRNQCQRCFSGCFNLNEAVSVTEFVLL